MSTDRKNSARNVEARIETGLQSGPVSIKPFDWPDVCGAEACFLGRTRCQQHPEYGLLRRLEYEVYEPMAGQLIRQMAVETAAQFGCAYVRVVHAQGMVDPGEASVVIQVATPHRAEAFAACRHLIDTIKRELPIWKREHWARGQTFVKGCCAHRSNSAAQ